MMGPLSRGRKITTMTSFKLLRNIEITLLDRRSEYSTTVPNNNEATISQADCTNSLV
jgi:hypothetical protein